MRCTLWMAVLAVTLGMGAQAHAKTLTVVKPAMSCESLAGQLIAPRGEAPARITGAAPASGSAGKPVCRVNGYVAPQVRFQLELPRDTWTQRLLFAGCGGFCGAITLRVLAADGCQPFTDGEFALVASDLGHDSGGNLSDAVWAADNAQGRRDFGFRAVHVVAVSAKAIIERYYGQPAAYAYFNGCSDGGREGMMEAQRYPADFNGIIAGAPVINATANNTIFHGWAAQRLTHADHSPVFSDADLTLLHEGALRACGSTLPGIEARLIVDPARCRFDPVTLACRSGQHDACLSAEQVAAARAIYSGALDAQGRALYFGYPVGSELSWNQQAERLLAAGGMSDFVGFLASEPPDAAQNFLSVQFTPAAVKRYDVYAADLNALDADLRPFRDGGGKLILWHGWSDNLVPPMDTVAYYRRVREDAGAGSDFVRLYMLPGVGHCAGGVGPDHLDALGAVMAWVEDGNAPSALTVSKSGVSVQSTPILPYQ